MGAPNVREGESVDIEIDSGAEVSCFPVEHRRRHVSTARDEAQHVWRSPRVAAGGGKLHEFGARILGLEAANVRGDVVNLLVRFRVMNIGKAFLSTQDLSRCGWETVFPAIFGNAYLVSEASDTRITLVKKTLCLVLESQAQTSQRVAVH